VVQLSGSTDSEKWHSVERRFGKKMTPEQIAEAQRLAREWLAQHQK